MNAGVMRQKLANEVYRIVDMATCSARGCSEERKYRNIGLGDYHLFFHFAVSVVIVVVVVGGGGNVVVALVVESNGNSVDEEDLKIVNCSLASIQCFNITFLSST